MSNSASKHLRTLQAKLTLQLQKEQEQMVYDECNLNDLEYIQQNIKEQEIEEEVWEIYFYC